MSYVHKDDTHNLSAPNQIVPIIIDLVKPKSIIDIGCGVGTFLYVFKEYGISDIKGVDGEWVNMDLLKKYISIDEFSNENLSYFVDVKRKYDLAICLEVAEHIAENHADNLIQTLTNSSDLILFSAAIPLQSGQFHVNEQWPTYWKEKFDRHQYEFLDVIRAKFWNMPFSEFWYKQNMFFAVKKEAISQYPFLADLKENSCLNIVHPDLFLKNSTLLKNLETGKEDLNYYFKLLVKAFLIKVGILKR